MFAECNNRLVHHTLQLYRNGFAQLLQLESGQKPGSTDVADTKTKPALVLYLSATCWSPFPGSGADARMSRADQILVPIFWAGFAKDLAK